ncbi:MAG TPA: flagellar basal body P-ring formation chaperone FlgA [Halomonas sp.]|nr:flagellar basal body P-ring formation chaperone FlgA [Halomonas sp.]
MRLTRRFYAVISPRCAAIAQRLSALLLALALSAPLPAGAAADDAALLERAHAFLYQRMQSLGDEVTIEIAPPSARMSACDNPQPFLPNPDAELRSRVSVGVRCGASGRQVRYLQASVQVTGTYLEIGDSVERGEILRRDQLVERRGDLTRLPHGTLLSADSAVGREATRRLAPGLTLQKHHLQAPTLVERGEAVVLEASGRGFRALRDARALDAGGRGDRVRARLPDRRILEGTVIGTGRVAVDN